jgi:hypothetical protein
MDVPISGQDWSSTGTLSDWLNELAGCAETNRKVVEAADKRRDSGRVQLSDEQWSTSL